MTYIPDLTVYNYRPFQKEPSDTKLLAVGWLDSSVTYRRGNIADRSCLLRKLKRLAATPMNLTRGFHYCQFCENSSTDAAGDKRRRGNGEIRINGENGKVYASPVLICHYIEAHDYRPPDEFLEAVMRMPDSGIKIAIIAAVERELFPLIKMWPRKTITHEERDFTFYESNYAVVVCGGIGYEAGRRAAQAAIVHYSPELLITAGVAGALTPELHVGDTIFPALVIDARDSSRHETAIPNARLGNSPLARTVLVSSPEIAGAEQKQKLAKAYGAHAVDMESAAVAHAAHASGLPFIAIKSISDDLDFELPDMAPFIRDGQIQSTRFAVYVALRPWLWLRVARLARNTRIASDNLCAWLRESVLTNTIVPAAFGAGEDARQAK